MPTLRWVGAGLMVAAGALAGGLAATSHVARAQTLTRAELTTVTGEENKDHRTCVWLTVTTSDGAPELGKAEGRDCGSSDSTTYNDKSTHTIPLDIEALDAHRNGCKNFKVHLWQKTHGGKGHDKWAIKKAKVTLYFSDGLSLIAERQNITLESHSMGDAPSVDFVQQ